MKLWLLKNKSERYWGKAMAFVVRAETEEQARSLASAGHGYEALDWDSDDEDDQGMPTNHFWEKPENASCIELLPEGEAGVIIRDLVED